MTQVGETISVGVIDEDESECPFDHEAPKPPTVENKLVGNGTTLASRMKSGSSTHLYEPLRQPQDPILNPRDILTPKKHPFYQKANVVEIEVIDYSTGEVHTHQYPVTCAAHHLVPAQESLKESPLLAYMVKLGDTEKLKDLDFSDGIVFADVGYDVNGSENGVFLPGSYSVGGGRGGLGIWTENDDKPDLEDEDATDVPDPASNELTGKLNEIDDNNRKWQYVSQAVALTPGQFHDRHQDYSDFIALALEKIFNNYEALRQFYIEEQNCKICKDRVKKFKDDGIPTPFGLVARLNSISERMSGHLNGATWTRNIYTSKWGQAFMKYVLAKKKRKR
jgi:hypothetical protein